MSVTYTALPLDVFYQHSDGVNWLQNWGLTVAAQSPGGRNPTPEEILRMLDDKNYDIDVSFAGMHWVADVSEKKTFYPKDIFLPRRMSVRSLDYSGDNQPINLGFDGSYELIKLLLQNLSTLCGPFVLMFDGEDPEIIG